MKTRGREAVAAQPGPAQPVATLDRASTLLLT